MQKTPKKCTKKCENPQIFAQNQFFMQKRSLFSFPFRHKKRKNALDHSQSRAFLFCILSIATHASFTAVPLAMTAGAPSVMLIVA